MSLALLIIDGDGTPHWAELRDGKSRVGRGTDNDFVLTGRGVSRHHALFDLDAGVLTIRDLDSTYGTRVNGSIVRKKRVGLGESIDIGVFRLVPLPLEAVDVRGHTSKEADDSDSHSKFEMAETGEFAVGPTSGVHVLMGEAQFVDSAVPSEGIGHDENTLHGVAEGRDDVSEEFPVNVNLVDGWGSDALARVLTAGSEGLISHTGGAAAQEAASYRKALGVLRRLAEAAASGQSRRMILRHGLDMLSGVVESETAVVLEVGDKGALKPLAIRHADALEKGELPVSRSVVTRAVREKAAVISENLASDPEYSVKDSVNIYRVGALLALPMMQNEQVVGVLYFTRKAGETFSDFEVNVAHVVASLASGILRGARLQKDVRAQKQRGAQFERFVNPYVRERLLENPTDPTSLEIKDLTVMVVRFLDLPVLSSRGDAQKLLTSFADIRTMLLDVIGRNGGTLVRACEEEAVVIFGVPEPARTDAQWALNTSMEITAYYEKVLKGREGLGKGVCVGMASGEVLWGVVGCPRHLEQVVLGGAKETAAELARVYGAHGVVMTDKTLEQIPTPKFKAVPFSSPNQKLPLAYRVVRKGN